MATIETLDASPSNVLRAFRGHVVKARPGYPEVLLLEVHDAEGGAWHLMTQDAEWSASRPLEDLCGSMLRDVRVGPDGRLRLRLDPEATIDVIPDTGDADDDPPAWELFVPGEMFVEFGPGQRWQVRTGQRAPKSHQPTA